jgi:hypothetical protein
MDGGCDQLRSLPLGKEILYPLDSGLNRPQRLFSRDAGNSQRFFSESNLSRPVHIRHFTDKVIMADITHVKVAC